MESEAMRTRFTYAMLAAAGLTAMTLATTGIDADDPPPSEDVDSPIAAPPVPPNIAAKMAARGAGGPSKPDFPKFADVSKDYVKVVSTADGARSLYTLWTRKKDAQVLAELPRNFESQKLFLAYTVAGGTATSGVQTGDMYAYWKRFDKRLALIEPNFAVRTTGDLESKKGHGRVFTDRVILDVPIVTMGPGGGPVIDMDALLLGQASRMFGFAVMGANPRLSKIAKAKAFPKNVEVAFELPLAGGRFGTLHYSFSALPERTGYKPRVADGRVGYFTTTYRDVGHPGKDTPWVRYINRWKLEKADPKLRLSPPKEPIVFYLEHTIPVRYRRWVREGVLEWNRAYEKVGLVNAIEVYQQDARTGAHMEKDPEDARYNFVLWTNAGMGFAIGPSRVDPRTGQILDADIVMDEGFITSWVNAWKKTIPEVAMENFGPETLDWLASRPQWDPRVRLAAPADRPAVMRELAHAAASGHTHPADAADPTLMGDDPFDGLAGRLSQVNGRCDYAKATSLELALFRLGPDLFEELASGGPAGEPADETAGADDPISGTWDGVAEVPEMGPMPFTLELKLAGDDSVSGTLAGGVYTGPITGRYDPARNHLGLTADIGDDTVIEFDLTVDGERLSGTATAGGTVVNVSAERTSNAPEEQAPPAAETGVSYEFDDEGDDDDEDETDEEDEDEDADEEEDAEDEADDAGPDQLLDGVPESFIGPMLRDVVMHEVGHTLGLRHNFKASTVHSLEEVNSDAFAGRPITGSVMDYNPININVDDGEVQGEYTMVTIGPYDYWAIEYGYTLDRDLKPVLARVSEPELIYGTDEETWDSDPRARRFDFGADPLNYAESQIRLVQHLRPKITDRMVKEGDSWVKARQGYELLLSRQFSAVSISANWIGGTYSNRDRKGDPGDRAPVSPIPAATQRRALSLVMDNMFEDDAFGLTPELLAHMGVDKWWDSGGMRGIFEDHAWPVHERILGLQSAALTMVMNPTTLKRVYDNEFRIDADEDALTLPEVIWGVSDEIWRELDGPSNGRFTDRKPMVSSLRRNLQREHLNRLIDLSLPNARFGVAAKPVANLSTYKLRDLEKKLARHVDADRPKIDAYTLAHFSEARVRIAKALDAQYIYNTDDMGGGMPMPFIFLQPEETGDGR
jgi:hypothetical protein